MLRTHRDILRVLIGKHVTAGATLLREKAATMRSMVALTRG